MGGSTADQWDNYIKDFDRDSELLEKMESLKEDLYKEKPRKLAAVGRTYTQSLLENPTNSFKDEKLRNTTGVLNSYSLNCRSRDRSGIYDPTPQKIGAASRDKISKIRKKNMNLHNKTSRYEMQPEERAVDNRGRDFQRETLQKSLLKQLYEKLASSGVIVKKEGDHENKAFKEMMSMIINEKIQDTNKSPRRGNNPQQNIKYINQTHISKLEKKIEISCGLSGLKEKLLDDFGYLFNSRRVSRAGAPDFQNNSGKDLLKNIGGGPRGKNQIIVKSNQRRVGRGGATGGFGSGRGESGRRGENLDTSFDITNGEVRKRLVEKIYSKGKGSGSRDSAGRSNEIENTNVVSKSNNGKQVSTKKGLGEDYDAIHQELDERLDDMRRFKLENDLVDKDQSVRREVSHSFQHH